MKHVVLSGLAAALAAGLATPAGAAITYYGLRSIDGASAQLAITTNGTLGVLDQFDIVDWTIQLTQGSDTFTLTSANSSVSLLGNQLSASASELSYDFGLDNGSFYQFLSFQADGAEPYLPIYCVQISGCSDFDGPAETLIAATGNPITREGRSDVSVLARSVVRGGAVPESATWALLVLGFGMAGAAMRARTGPQVRIGYVSRCVTGAEIRKNSRFA